MMLGALDSIAAFVFIPFFAPNLEVLEACVIVIFEVFARLADNQPRRLARSSAASPGACSKA